MMVSGKAACAVVVAILVMGWSLSGARASDYKSSPLRGDYFEFSRLLGDSGPPTQSDAKVAIHITGRLAADLFRHLGPAAKSDYCPVDNQIEARERNDLSCVLYKKTGAECWFGMDPKTGRSVPGIVC